MGMTIDELKCIIGEYKLRIPPTVYYELLADLEDAEFIPKADYETRLKADMVAMLTEIQLEIEEKFNDRPFSYNHHQRTEFYRDIDEIIQQKINSLKE